MVNDSQQNENKSASGKAIATFICGLLSVLCLGFITGVPAIVIGMTELKAIQDKKSPASGELITKGGYILGIIGTAVSVAAFLVGIVFFAMGMSLGAASLIHSIIAK